jgi:hypothetical protein
MAGAEQRPANPDNPGQNDSSAPGERRRPTIKITRLRGVTHAQLRALGSGSEVRGAVRYMEEVGRLLDAGQITPDTRPLGEEIDMLERNPIPPPPDDSIN